jgi:hypothetical protein
MFPCATGRAGGFELLYGEVELCLYSGSCYPSLMAHENIKLTSHAARGPLGFSANSPRFHSCLNAGGVADCTPFGAPNLIWVLGGGP